MRPGTDGVWFTRTGRGGGRVKADWRNVAATRLQTVVAAGGTRVATVEHLMSALAGLGVWHAEVEIDGEEVPILDGSAAPFVASLAPATEPAPPPAHYAVRRTVAVRERGRFAALIPAPAPRFDVAIDFPDAAIGRQRVRFDDPARYAAEIAPARTFGRLADLNRMRRRALARGASLDNAIAVDGPRIVNPGGLRFPDEFVRHKVLDAIGDLALAGRPLCALYRAEKAGHRMNYALLARLFSDEENVVLLPE